MIEMNEDYAVRFYSIIESSTKHPTVCSMEPNLFYQIFPGLDSATTIRDPSGKALTILFDKQEALTYLKNTYNIYNHKDLTCLSPSMT